MQAREIGVDGVRVRAQLGGPRQLDDRRLRLAEADARGGEPHPRLERAPVVAHRARERLGGLRVVGQAGAELAEQEPRARVLRRALRRLLRGGERFVRLALRAEGPRKAEPQRDRLGGERERGGEVGLGARRVALRLAAAAASAAQLDEAPRDVSPRRIEVSGAREQGDGGVGVASLRQREAVAGRGLRVVRARALSALERVELVLGPPEALVRGGEREQRAAVGGPERHRALQGGGGLAVLAEAEAELAERAPRVGVLGREPDHLAVALRGLRRAPVRLQGLGERGVRVEAIRVGRHGADQHRHALLGPAERQVRVARADEGRDRVDALAEGGLVGLGRAARVAVRREHVAEQQRRVHAPSVEGERLARGGCGLVPELSRRVGAGRLQQERGVVGREPPGLREVRRRRAARAPVPRLPREPGGAPRASGADRDRRPATARRRA